ncbi:MAG: hypothetical protein EWV53_10630 [Microcystis panniformis Mp_MB_F_20051200_S9]|uniref:DUF7305 domain-containing protein n=1 Tax=Microcystis panniformis Mp_MB_F_20051200_S9 TaxID=2486223 RepID=A0A552PZF1_9CHRO|nr:MAG: hypothetical protein EWV43_07390 [Microcystis panniformis Mp_MB_F_20080800_S26D]TRV51713.1 MAG: hypothetical protein EWV87_05995 [Microcystis panniformis Mp_GB_SS_20050300_S99]TRV54012.1 MAG: hypothetical protein EWV42_04825 [Microcystis panniformis Mp_GB_SS_20050300_S99D]TRV57600.1 MAG: hypothetical protein EWV69_15700 [Microcystis panniformis Mp_MB_F_20080800_S26]TRV62361.1 MAG: hypothetical protein EWV53_10630 [Microcystis panniformis Mp_MB_F_20051200_S9]TRV65988.1 MAG: hypothetical
MKNRLYLHLMANKEKGFALPFAVLIGLILMVTGITMMMRAQGDQSKVIAQKARADALRSSEAGVTRVQDLLNSVRVMAKVDSNSNCTPKGCWQTAQVVLNPSTDLQEDLKKLYTAASCSDPNAAATLSEKIDELRGLSGGQWFDLGNNLYYRVVGYNFDNTNPPPNGLGWGVLTLEGLSLSPQGDPNNIDGDNAASRNRVVVIIPIFPSRPLAFTRTTVPVLWVSEGAMVSGQDSVDFQGDVVNLECDINRNDIKQPTPALNPPYKAQFIDNTIVPFPNLPAIPNNLRPEQQNLELTSSETFPRTGDTPSPNGVYEYIVNNINLSGGHNITITPGQRVVFYVKGNINGAIEHDCSSVTEPTVCKPGNLQIYADNGLGSAAPEICLKGDQRLEAFIFAPDYSLGKSGNGDFVGAAWGKNWGKNSGCVSGSSAAAVGQGVEWTELITNLKPSPSALNAAARNLPQLGKIANWCEEPIDTTGASKCVP